MKKNGHWISGTYKQKTSLKFKGLSRNYLLHIPSNISKEKLPLFVVLHGAFSTAGQIEKQSGFSELADEQGFCVAYPNGIGVFGLLQHWNAGHCCGKAKRDGIDDVQYINTVIDDALSSGLIDPNKIYLVGYSNGGMMAYRYASEEAARIKGLAVVAGAINSDTQGDDKKWVPSQPTKLLPTLIMHGTADDAVPVIGGESPEKSNGIIYASVEEAEKFWRAHNQSKAPVKVILLDGWKHPWPGPYFTNRKDAPEKMKGYDAAAVISDFFQQRK